MRSSKSRSRSKTNRPRTLGNIINRVFDSSGPEGKVRGTPQQIIEKYQFLARDAQLSNDRVAAENFNQHAEHYMRMLAEAQREMAAEQEARQGQYNQNSSGNGGQVNQGQPYQGQAGNGGNANQNGGGQHGGGQHGGGQNQPGQQRDRGPREDREHREFRGDRNDRNEREYAREERAPMAIDVVEPDDDLGLVETPEMELQPQPRPQPRPQPQPRQQRQPREAVVAAVVAEPVAVPMAKETVAKDAIAEAPATSDKADKAPRRARSPRKPKAPVDGTPEAAE